MQADERRRLELTRLADEIVADSAVLERVGRTCETARTKLGHGVDRGALAEVAVDLHRYYTAVENVLERIERAVGVLPTAGPTWHRDLLHGAARPLADARPAILSMSAATELDALLSFRHFFRHAYAAEFDPARLDLLAGQLARCHDTVLADLRHFVAHLQAVAARLGG
jgi:hypothetical protein